MYQEFYVPGHTHGTDRIGTGLLITSEMGDHLAMSITHCEWHLQKAGSIAQLSTGLVERSPGRNSQAQPLTAEGDISTRP